MFGISTPLQFYQKLVQEFDDFCEAPSSARHAMNFVITAYHLHEWVWRGFLKNDVAKRRELGVSKSIGGFKAWLDGKSIWYAQMQALANGSKHFQPRDLQIRIHHVGPFNTAAFNEVAFNEGYSYFVWASLKIDRISYPPHSSLKRSCVSGGISSAFTGLTPSCRRAGRCFPTKNLLLALKHLDLGLGGA